MKRVVRRPKVSVADSGLASHLSGVTAESQQRIPGALHFGKLLEGFVANELAKQQIWFEMRFSLMHFRNRDGKEVDIVVELADGRVIGLEIKAGITVRSPDFQGLELLREQAGDAFIGGFVLHAGDRVISFGDRLRAAPLSIIWQNPSEHASIPDARLGALYQSGRIGGTLAVH